MIKKDQNIIKSKTLLSKEISVLKDLNHDHIVRLYDHCISADRVYLVMEYCNCGDLAEYLQIKRTLPEDTIKHLLYQIGLAMDAMNRQDIMHRDMKPGNILLSYHGEFRSVNDIPGNQLVFKLADFGFARFLRDGLMAVTMCGSPMYMAPEVLMCKKYDALADIWSMGIIVYQCLTGRAPFYANTPEALKNIYENTPVLRPKIPPTTSAPLKDLLLKMLVRKPSHRIDFQKFLQHPFLQKLSAVASPSRRPASISQATFPSHAASATYRPDDRGSGSVTPQGVHSRTVAPSTDRSEQIQEYTTSQDLSYEATGMESDEFTTDQDGFLFDDDDIGLTPLEGTPQRSEALANRRALYNAPGHQQHRFEGVQRLPDDYVILNSDGSGQKQQAKSN